MSQATVTNEIPSAFARETGTRLKLVLAAERLLAKRGFSNISQRQILVEAEQKNASAMSYHFGSMEGLVQAVIELRMNDVNARRLKVLDEIDAGKRPRSFQSVTYAGISPLLVELEPRPEGNFYLRLLSQLLTGHVGEARLMVNSPISSSIARMVGLYHALRPDLSAEAAHFHFQIVRNLTVLTLSQVEGDMEIDPTFISAGKLGTAVGYITKASISILEGSSD